MAAQAGLALGHILALEFFWDRLQHLDVGLDALRLDRAPGRRIITRGGQPMAASLPTGISFCTEPLPNERVPRRVARLVLERARHDFGSGCRAAIDQHHETLAIGNVTVARYQRLVSSGLRPRVETISPLSRKVSPTPTA